MMHVSLTGDVLELFDTLVHGLEGISDVVLQLLEVDDGQWVIQPALVPS